MKQSIKDWVFIGSIGLILVACAIGGWHEWNSPLSYSKLMLTRTMPVAFWWCFGIGMAGMLVHQILEQKL